MTRTSFAILAFAAAAIWAAACAAPQPPPPGSGQAAAASSSELAEETRARECNDLVTVMNRAAEEIDRIGDGGPESAPPR